MATRDIKRIIPNRLVRLIIVRTNPAIIKLIVSDVVVIMIKAKSKVGFCMLLKNPVRESSKFLVMPDSAIVLTMIKETMRKKITDSFAFQNGLTVSL
jgi:hypothetical protein